MAGLLNASNPDVNYRVRFEVETRPWEVKKFWRIWNDKKALRNYKKANAKPCPL